MELFYTKDITDGICRLSEEESAHCVRVLRHRSGDHINVIDGQGTFYDCTIIDASPKSVTASVDAIQECWGAHDYHLTMAVCPTKNIDRYEWFAEKATEIGIDTIVPLIGEHSERKIVKTERVRKILLSATKQSLKGSIPQICETLSVFDYIQSVKDSSALKLIAYCFEDDTSPRASIKAVLDKYYSDGPSRDIIIMIGPEGDFSRKEAECALECGFIPIHLGESRLRTETAALTAVQAVYLQYMK